MRVPRGYACLSKGRLVRLTIDRPITVAYTAAPLLQGFFVLGERRTRRVR